MNLIKARAKSYYHLHKVDCKKRYLLLFFPLVFIIGCSKNDHSDSQFPPVPQETLNTVYEQIRTPYKYGIVLKPEASNILYDSPTVFQVNGKWYITYIAFDGNGYDTYIAESDDLLHWTKKGRILSKNLGSSEWDNAQRAGYVSLVNMRFGGDYSVAKFNNSYWLSYLGGSSAGYEKGILSIGLAHTDQITNTAEWTRLPQPVLSPTDKNARRFENKALYKSSIVFDSLKTTGYSYLMFYNGEASSGEGESITMAGSNDMLSWNRLGANPLISHKNGISGDPQIVRIDSLYIMFYYGYSWRPGGAFDNFACSKDLYHWTEWTGDALIKPSEAFDQTFAHKPWVVKYNGIVYHFYDAVGESGRVIAVATSKDLGKSSIR